RRKCPRITKKLFRKSMLPAKPIFRKDSRRIIFVGRSKELDYINDRSRNRGAHIAPRPPTSIPNFFRPNLSIKRAKFKISIFISENQGKILKFLENIVYLSKKSFLKFIILEHTN